MYLVGLHARCYPPVELRSTSGVLSCLVGLNARYILTCPLLVISGKQESQVKKVKAGARDEVGQDLSSERCIW